VREEQSIQKQEGSTPLKKVQPLVTEKLYTEEEVLLLLETQRQLNQPLEEIPSPTLSLVGDK